MQPCPVDYVRCYTEEEFDDLQHLLEEYDIAYDMSPAPMGDVEAVVELTWQLLLLSPWELITVSIPMTVMACYALSIYAAFKYIQSKFSVPNQGEDQ